VESNQLGLRGRIRKRKLDNSDADGVLEQSTGRGKQLLTVCTSQQKRGDAWDPGSNVSTIYDEPSIPRRAC